MMDAKGIRNMQSIPVVVNKHNTARVASCWFIIYYIIPESKMSNKWDVGVWTGSSWLRIGTGGGHL